MPPQAIRDGDADYSFLNKECSSEINFCSFNVWLPASRWPCYPAAGVNGITVERSSNLVGVSPPGRPPIVVIGIIGGMPGCAPAETAPPPNGVPAAALAAGAAAVQAVGADNAPTVVAWPMPAETAGTPAPRPPMPVNVNAPVPEPIPADWATPNSLAAVVAALAAVAVLPAVNSLDIMLIGIDANFIGVLSSLSSDVAELEDEEPDESVAVVVTPLRACADERPCRACGVAEIS